jgi:hypothetical protein
MAANKVTAVHGRCGIKFQARTLSRPGNRTALFLDPQLEAASLPVFPNKPSGTSLPAQGFQNLLPPCLPPISLSRLASQRAVPTFQSNMQPKSNDPGKPLDAAAN